MMMIIMMIYAKYTGAFILMKHGVLNEFLIIKR